MTNPLSVLLIGINFAPETTGIAPYSAGLADELASRGERVRVITAHPHYPAWHFQGSPARRSREIRNHVAIDRVRHRLPMKPSGLSRALSEISFGVNSSLTRFGKPDVVVLVSPALLAAGLAYVRLRLLRRAPVVVWVQDLYSLGLRELGERPGRLAHAVARLEGWLLRRADGVVVIHERFRDTVVNDLGVRPAAVSVVRNWSHLDDQMPVDRESDRAALGWADTDFVVLHAGNMGVKQGLENVVEAAKLATARGDNVRFVLLGDGNQRAHLAELAADVPAMTMLGSLPDREFRKALGAADALLVNERAGVAGMAVPSKLTSYFTTGLPVIAATDPGSVTESEVLLAAAGPVVPAGDPRALLDAARALSTDPGRARAFGDSGRKFREQRLTPRASFDTFTQLLRGLAEGRRPAATRESGTD